MIQRSNQTEYQYSLCLLISSAGRRVGLIECFRKAALDLSIQLKIVAIDAVPQMSPACHVADKSYEVPRVNSEVFIRNVLDICKKEGVTLIIPTIDTELEVYSNARELFREIAVDVVVSGSGTLKLARDKEQFAHFLSQIGLSAPLTISAENFKKNQDRFNSGIVIKPRDGSRSIGLIRYDSKDEISEKYLISKNIVQECWQGEEYTVNAFIDEDRSKVCIVPHLRHEVRAGEVSKGITRRIPEITAAGLTLLENLKDVVGPICFQLIRKTDGTFAIFELNARFGGGYPLADAAGGTFAKWIIERHLGLPSTVNDDWESDLSMIRYDSAIYFKNK